MYLLKDNKVVPLPCHFLASLVAEFGKDDLVVSYKRKARMTMGRGN